ncbi:Hypothetical predicted protein, partial [Mytilus galloprovincialis]
CDKRHLKTYKLHMDAYMGANSNIALFPQQIIHYKANLFLPMGRSTSTPTFPWIETNVCDSESKLLTVQNIMIPRKNNTCNADKNLMKPKSSLSITPWWPILDGITTRNTNVTKKCVRANLTGGNIVDQLLVAAPEMQIRTKNKSKSTVIDKLDNCLKNVSEHRDKSNNASANPIFNHFSFWAYNSKTKHLEKSDMRLKFLVENYPFTTGALGTVSLVETRISLELNLIFLSEGRLRTLIHGSLKKREKLKMMTLISLIKSSTKTTKIGSPRIKYFHKTTVHQSPNDAPDLGQPNSEYCLFIGVLKHIYFLNPTSSSALGHHYVPPDKVSCVIWEKGECQKVDLTALELGWTIIEKVDDIPESSDYILIGFTFSVLLCLVPLVFRLYHVKEFPSLMSLEIITFLSKVWCCLMHNSWRLNLIMMNGIIQRFWLSSVFFFLLSVADRTFKQRLLYAKHFCYLTSSRRAKKFDMPHFRLNKVRNIKTWLSIRSYLKKRGPQRSVDVIVSASFLITIVLITLMCLQLLKDADTYLDFLCNWELLFWSMTLGVYLFRFLTLGLKINKKYRNLSVLITEQINLYLQMEQKPHKKEELMVANNVLKLAEDLLQELESPFKVSGITANPVIYNITRVVVLSAFSAVLTELLGFKLKLYKIKLKA